MEGPESPILCTSKHTLFLARRPSVARRPGGPGMLGLGPGADLQWHISSAIKWRSHCCIRASCAVRPLPSGTFQFGYDTVELGLSSQNGLYLRMASPSHVNQRDQIHRCSTIVIYQCRVKEPALAEKRPQRGFTQSSHSSSLSVSPSSVPSTLKRYVARRTYGPSSGPKICFLPRPQAGLLMPSM